MPAHWVHDQLSLGRAVVLVDGVDEVPESRRLDVYMWLQDLVETYKLARFIVASRPSAIEEGWLNDKEFTHSTLRSMELPQIDAFIDHWRNAVREQVREEEEKITLGPLAEHLKGVLRRSFPIYNLATIPLLCAMLCALHRDRQRRLPSDRIELYEAGCSMLLERRDIERYIELRDYPPLSYRQKRILLQDLAYWLMANDWQTVTRQRAIERLDRRRTNMQGTPRDAQAADILRGCDRAIPNATGA